MAFSRNITCRRDSLNTFKILLVTRKKMWMAMDSWMLQKPRKLESVAHQHWAGNKKPESDRSPILRASVNLKSVTNDGRFYTLLKFVLLKAEFCWVEEINSNKLQFIFGILMISFEFGFLSLIICYFPWVKLLPASVSNQIQM